MYTIIYLRVEISVRGVARRRCSGSPCKRRFERRLIRLYFGSERLGTVKITRDRNVDLKIKKPVTDRNP